MSEHYILNDGTIRPLTSSEISEALNDAEPVAPASAYHPDHSDAIGIPTKVDIPTKVEIPTIPAEWYNPFG